MIDYLGNKKFSVNKICKDNNEKVLIIEAKIETGTFILLNLYNSNSETEQLQAISDVDGWKPVLKNKSVSKVLKLPKNMTLKFAR